MKQANIVAIILTILVFNGIAIEVAYNQLSKHFDERISEHFDERISEQIEKRSKAETFDERLTEWIMFICLGSPVDTCPTEDFTIRRFESEKDCKDFQETLRTSTAELHTQCEPKILKES